MSEEELLASEIPEIREVYQVGNRVFANKSEAVDYVKWDQAERHVRDLIHQAVQETATSVESKSPAPVFRDYDLGAIEGKAAAIARLLIRHPAFCKEIAAVAASLHEPSSGVPGAGSARPLKRGRAAEESPRDLWSR
ncbi:hypothetical protein EVJ50_04570 [Synechococcus sp. RSCCF101]|uniref:hypothetical protein n=1 Tax=Synechococcus sp. RSCCF101 TaxID=2511069 RepID=UPI001244E52E|nr:hypothetical protein [Synechococcus sp. RSCCF101]QEY31635.1 hypothetical protein EVJ50_04570 [Synechococcus sp. RSCCF101]